MVLFAGFANAKTKTFEMNYEVTLAKVVCFQACKYNCEEGDMQFFYDSTTYNQMRNLEDDQTYDINAFCEGSSSHNPTAVPVNFVNEHMFTTAKENPTRAAQIVEEQGTIIPLVIYTKIKPQVQKFIDGLLDDHVQD